MYVRSNTVSVTLTSSGGGSGYSTDFNGAVHGVYILISKAAPANSKVVITSETTTKSILTILDPSTLGGYYYPRKIVHGSTGAVLGSSTPCYEVLDNERIKVNMAATSSGLAAETLTATFNVI